MLVVAYHKINQYGEYAGAQGRIDPIIAMWVPFLLMTALVVWMYHVIAHRPGGQPIGALERAAALIGAPHPVCCSGGRGPHDQPSPVSRRGSWRCTPSSCSSPAAWRC